MIKYIVYKTYLKRSFIMNKIKDFFYNKNDIIIVLIILVAAAFIIYGRIGAIMDYPKVFAEKTAESQQIESATEEEAVVSSASSEGQTSQSSTGDVRSSSESGSTKSDSGYISIVIKDSDTSSSVARKLYKAGVVDSAKDFESYIKKKGKAKSIKSGNFKIPSKASDKEILNIIAN